MSLDLVSHISSFSYRQARWYHVELSRQTGCFRSNSFSDPSSRPLSVGSAIEVESAFTQSLSCYSRPFSQLRELKLSRLCELILLVFRGLGFHLWWYLEDSSCARFPVWFYFHSIRKARILLRYRLDSRFLVLFILNAILVQWVLLGSRNRVCGTW